VSRLLQTGAGIIIFAAGLAPLAGQPPQPQAPRPGRSFLISRDVPNRAAVERGQKIFVARCGFCHGSNANGGESGPDLVRSVLALDDEGGDKIGPVIRSGRPDKGMPAFPLSDDQVKDVAAFLRSRQQAAIDRNTYTIQNIVTGDAKKGQAYFYGAGRCNTCHSPTGDLAKIAAKYDPVTLQSRLVYPRTQRPRRAEGPEPKAVPTSVTVTLASGQTITGTLDYMDDFDVALRDAAGDYHSFTRDAGVKVDVRDPLAAHEELLKKYTDDEMHDLVAYLETLK
jgi:cytochrome c oxidase cbb3-type subunit III